MNGHDKAIDEALQSIVNTTRTTDQAEKAAIRRALQALVAKVTKLLPPPKRKKGKTADDIAGASPHAGMGKADRQAHHGRA